VKSWPENNNLMPKRNRQAEDQQSKQRLAENLAAIRVARDAGELDKEVMQLAQALILCGLPYRPTDAIRVERQARLADGSIVSAVRPYPSAQTEPSCTFCLIRPSNRGIGS